LDNLPNTKQWDELLDASCRITLELSNHPNIEQHIEQFPKLEDAISRAHNNGRTMLELARDIRAGKEPGLDAWAADILENHVATLAPFVKAAG
jgi:hypothetical protein